jgi:hypothetical protein
MYAVKMHRRVAKNAKKNLCALCASAVKKNTTKKKPSCVCGKKTTPKEKTSDKKDFTPAILPCADSRCQ